MPAALPVHRRTALVAIGADIIAILDRRRMNAREDDRWWWTWLPFPGPGHMPFAVAMAILAALGRHAGTRVGFDSVGRMHHAHDDGFIVAIQASLNIRWIAEGPLRGLVRRNGRRAQYGRNYKWAQYTAPLTHHPSRWTPHAPLP